MSGGGAIRSGGGAGAAAGIPGGSRRMVQSLKEIVNCSESEIYAMLKECNMDPSEAVHRLLSQDSFHEVKSKRDKKKEGKEIPETRSRTIISSSNRGAKASNDSGGRTSSTQIISTVDDGATCGKPVKKDNGLSIASTTSILGPAVPVNNLNRRTTFSNGSISVDNIEHSNAGYGVPMEAKRSVISQSSWSGAVGHVTMADIVKRGKPTSNPSSTPITGIDMPYKSHNAHTTKFSNHIAKNSAVIQPSESNHGMRSSQDHDRILEADHEVDLPSDSHVPQNSWNEVEESSAGIMSPRLESSIVSSDHDGTYLSPILLGDEFSKHADPHGDENSLADSNGSNPNLDSIRPPSSSDKQAIIDSSEVDSGLIDTPLNNISSLQSQRLAFEHNQVEDINAEIPSAVSTMQHLRLHEDIGAPVADRPVVIIPNHLQVTADCSHLSFGSFGSDISASFSAPYSSKPFQSNLESSSGSDNMNLVDQRETMNLESYDGDQLRPTTSEQVDTRTSVNTRNYDAISTSQPDIVRNDALNAASVLQYNVAPVSGYSLPSTAQSNMPAYAFPQANSQMPNISPFSSLMQPFNTVLASTSIASPIPPVRNLDLGFSSFVATQAVPTQTSPISGPTSSMAEVPKSAIFSSQQSQQTLPSNSIATGPAHPQHMPVHPYSHSTLPLGPFASMIGYPFLHHSYTYMPSPAFPHAYAGNGAMHQSSPATLHNSGLKYNLLQYKNNTSLPQTAVVTPGYGGFGSSNAIPGNYMLNPTQSNSTIDEALNSQYKEANHYVLQQNENPAMWTHGASSRTLPALPSNTFYSFLGQNQHSFRQGQQPALGNVCYPNMYNSQPGTAHENQQNSSDGNLNGAQGLQTQQSHLIWHKSY